MKQWVPILVFAFLLAPTLFLSAQTNVVDARRAELERNLAAIEVEIAAQRKLLEGKQTEKVSLERDVAILDAQIKQAELTIRARDLSIQRLTQDIVAKQGTINSLSEKMLREKESLAEILRKTNEIDRFSLPEIILSNKDFGAFFADIGSFEDIRDSLQESFVEIEETKSITTEQKAALEDKKLEETELRKIQEAQKRRIQEKRTERNNILKITQGEEAAYQKILSAKEKDAATIRTELFQLRESDAIPFSKAYEYAVTASKETGVRPAFILGIIAEESNLGQNVGTGSWTTDMHPTRDRPVFQAITAHLGLDPNKVPVSKKPWYGWGGAMGPAQFIPSTWACFAGYVNTSNGKCGPNNGSWAGPWEYDKSKDRIGKRTGNYPSNPWNPQDAIMAATLYLWDNDADLKTSKAEFRAAMCYLAGCGNVGNKSLWFYGDDVMCLALKYQRNIDILEGTNIAAQKQGDLYHTQCL